MGKSQTDCTPEIGRGIFNHQWTRIYTDEGKEFLTEDLQGFESAAAPAYARGFRLRRGYDVTRRLGRPSPALLREFGICNHKFTRMYNNEGKAVPRAAPISHSCQLVFIRG